MLTQRYTLAPRRENEIYRAQIGQEEKNSPCSCNCSLEEQNIVIETQSGLPKFVKIRQNVFHRYLENFPWKMSSMEKLREKEGGKHSSPIGSLAWGVTETRLRVSQC